MIRVLGKLGAMLALLSGVALTQSAAPHELTVSARPASQVRADCPLLRSTNRPETFIMLVVSGEQDLLVRQAAFRSVPTDEVIELLGGTVRCQTGDVEAPRNRRGLSFSPLFG